ncbi:MAG: hypothetical protein HY691_12840 [Chloroflexi bacterium]|nr:hypothetical protein [Chloroflexota bacterium]
MTAAAALLADLRARGVELVAAGDRLRWRAPAGVLSEQDRAALAENKSALLRLLAAKGAAVAEANYRADPRPDIAHDHQRWTHLLACAFALDGHDPGGVYGALHGLRCLGARLADDGHGLRLLPGELAHEEYRALRQRWLVPHREALTLLLGELGPAGGGAA